jgi:hypothetical protein
VIRQDPRTPGDAPTFRDTETGRFTSRAEAASAALGDLARLAAQLPSPAEIRAHATACAFQGRPCAVAPTPTKAQRRAAKTAAALFG